MGGSVGHGLKEHEIGGMETKKETELSERVEGGPGQSRGKDKSRDGGSEGAPLEIRAIGFEN